MDAQAGPKGVDSSGVEFAGAEREYLTDAERDEMIWLNRRNAIAERLRDTMDVEVVKRVAELVGYEGGD